MTRKLFSVRSTSPFNISPVTKIISPSPSISSICRRPNDLSRATCQIRITRSSQAVKTSSQLFKPASTASLLSYNVFNCPKDGEKRRYQATHKKRPSPHQQEFYA